MIINKAGIPLWVKSEVKEVDKALMGGFLSAIQNFSEIINKSCVNRIDLKDNTFFYSVKDSIYSIVLAEASDEVESRIYHIIAERLARKFIEKYSNEAICNWCGEETTFEDFELEYKSITSEVSKMLKQSQKDFISKYFAEAAANSNVAGMIVFDLVLDEILASDIPQDFSEKNFESFSSMLFSFINRLAAELKVGEVNELLLRAKNYWIGGFRKGTLAVLMIFHHEYFGKILPDIVTLAID